MVLRGIQFLIPPQQTVLDFYLTWHDRRPSSASVLFKSWHSIVKITWWKIWLARNNFIFSDQRPISQVVAIKSLSLFAEVFGLTGSSFPITLWRNYSIQSVGKILCVLNLSVFLHGGFVEVLRISILFGWNLLQQLFSLTVLPKEILESQELGVWSSLWTERLLSGLAGN